MTSRRRLLKSVALTAAASRPVAAAEPALDAVRQVAEAHGLSLSEERVRLLRPLLERRQTQLRTLRQLAIDDRIAPTPTV